MFGAIIIPKVVASPPRPPLPPFPPSAFPPSPPSPLCGPFPPDPPYPATPPYPPIPPFAPSPAILLQRRVRSDAFAECANLLANEDATSIVATAPMSRNLIECQSFIFSLKFVLGQWFICIKLFYSLNLLILIILKNSNFFIYIYTYIYKYIYSGSFMFLKKQCH